MYTISRATKADMPAIDHLMSKYGMMINDNYLTKRDIALQAREDDGTLVGFVWVGIMANNTIAYVDKVCIDPEHHHKGILQKLYRKAFQLARQRGVRETLGFIKHDAHHAASCFQVLRCGVGAEQQSYTKVSAQLSFMISQCPYLGYKE